MDTTIGVVLVTYNRIDKLKTALQCFERQSILPKYIVVVDNASTDGTRDFLEEWKAIESSYRKYVFHSDLNTGGSGGFNKALELGINLDAELIWASDDDAFPEDDALAIATKFITEHCHDNYAAICSSVINNGRYDLSHRKNYHIKGLNIIEEWIPEDLYKNEYFELTTYSYVGAIMRKELLKSVGLPNKDYFLWCDDTEHSLRMSKKGKIACVPAIRVHHDVGVSNSGLTWKTYYGFRNLTDMYRKHFPKRCFLWFVYKMKLKTLLKDMKRVDQLENKIIRIAINDGKQGKLGIHETYKPGWKP